MVDRLVWEQTPSDIPPSRATRLAKKPFEFLSCSTFFINSVYFFFLNKNKKTKNLKKVEKTRYCITVDVVICVGIQTFSLRGIPTIRIVKILKNENNCHGN